MQYFDKKPLSSIGDVLRAVAQVAPESPAIVAHRSRAPLSYRALDGFVSGLVASLNAAGLGRGDRVAIVLPNGPEMALAFLGVAAGATAAPLNPAYRASELEFYLSDLDARAVMVLADDSATPAPAVSVARTRGIPILEVVPVASAPAGVFELRGASGAAARSDGYAEEDDVALMLHTSGSTSRPKLVPLTHANVCASARNVARALELSPADRCMNVMPLFHIHGLVAALLASVAAGATVACTEGFDAPRFFETLDDLEPSWYTAVPTMHRAVLDRAPAHRDTIARRPLRFIRSSSSALAPQLMRDLEAAFGAPVIEAFGMTEASHQVASNPLPPSERKPGSVGLAAGPEVAIMDEEGSLLPSGASGEIVIRGANVTTGYENNPEANASSFTNGWFRTGDRGRLDDAGYLFVEGRVKEIINRGGEKISPREIDEVLLDHPAVAQVVAFAVPDAKLGEDVAAAIVLGEGMSTTERELRAFVASRLSDFKVPRRVVFLTEIPKGPTGKLQRIGLAATLGLTGESLATRAEYAPPTTASEVQIAGLWAQVLGVENPGVRDDFFDSGGDSILAARLLARVREATGVDVELVAFFETPTIAGLVDEVSSAGDRSSDLERLLAEVEDLSEEEALRLLAGDGDA